MIKLTNILSELQIANPNITPEKAAKYFNDNIRHNININYNEGWKDYMQICKPYIEKYNIYLYLSSSNDYKKLSKPDLIKFYNEMRALVQKYK